VADQPHDVGSLNPPTSDPAPSGSPLGSSRPPLTVEWRMSGYDLRKHAFPEIGDTFSQALCEHSVPTHLLIVDDPPVDTCMACQLIHGDLIADRAGDIMAAQIRDFDPYQPTTEIPPPVHDAVPDAAPPVAGRLPESAEEDNDDLP
jgi:hypothetical protein